MRRMMRVGAAVAALLMAATVVQAQDARGGGGGGQRGGRGGGGGITQLLQGITVDAAVQTKIDTLVAHYTAASTKLRTDLGLPMGRGSADAPPPDPAKMAEYQTKNTEMVNKLRTDVRALLTPEQQATFDTNLANMPQRGRRGGGF